MEENIVQEQKRSFPIWSIIYKNLLFIVIITLVLSAVGFVYGKFAKKPIYVATSSVFLSFTISEKSSDNQNVSLTKVLLASMPSILSGEKVQNIAREKYGKRDIYASSVGFSYSDKSLIFTMTYTDGNRDSAKNKLEAYIAASAEFLQTEGETNLPAASEFNVYPTQKEIIVNQSNTDTITYALIGFVAGLVLSVAFFVLKYIFDNKLKDPDELESIVGVPLLSYIDDIDE